MGAIAAVLPGASWQRCRTHFMKNLLCRVPHSAHRLWLYWWGPASPKPSAEEVQIQLQRVIMPFENRFPEVARCYMSQESLERALEPPAVEGEINHEVVPLLMASRCDELEDGAIQLIRHLTGRGQRG